MEIIIDIAPDGTVTKEVKGVKGTACLSDPLSMGLDKVLGTPVKTTKTADFYAQTTTTRQYQRKG